MSAGQASRLELYGSLWLVVMGMSFLYDRMTCQMVLIDGLIVNQKQPVVIQQNNNNQQVIVEDNDAKLIRELAEKRGWKSD